LDGHWAQTAPPLPQPASVLPGKQNIPLQQPLQLPHDETLVQALLTHEALPLHSTHALPPEPQAAPAVPLWQLPVLSQHPLQLARLQPPVELTQLPERQTWFPVQGGEQLPSSGASSSGYTQAASSALATMAEGSPWFL
jgi:hypothetical protein